MDDEEKKVDAEEVKPVDASTPSPTEPNEPMPEKKVDVVEVDEAEERPEEEPVD
jgi:hypothetical protein